MKPVTTLIFLLLISGMALCQPKLSSYPSAKATIFLDFDGEYVEGTPWNGGKPFYCEPAGLSDVQITEIFNRVSEDFRPFDLNITTDSSVFLAAPLAQRIRVIVTPTSDWYTGVGGVSFTRSFTWGDGTPAFVFPDRLGWGPKAIAECCSHESGHTLGLSHQAKYNESCALVTTYNDGLGSGQIGWAPVMGNSYYRNFSGWNNGPTPSGCTADQDNLSIITGINGFTYRADDHKDNPVDGASIIQKEDNSIQGDGVITTSTDIDAFQLNILQQGTLSLSAKPFSVGANNEGANLDVMLQLLNDQFEVIATYDPLDKLDASIDTVLNAGRYYVMVKGTGNQYASNYGSLGSYSLSGNFSPLQVMPISKLELKGFEDHNKHRLVWEIICDESIASQEIQVSENSNDFKKLAVVSETTRSFEYVPLLNGNLYYRIKVATQAGKISYSNIMSIKSTAHENEITIRSTIVKDKIELNSLKPFAYLLTDLTGKILKKGNLPEGFSVINISNSPNGIYIIQMISNSQRSTQRIVRM